MIGALGFHVFKYGVDGAKPFRRIELAIFPEDRMRPESLRDVHVQFAHDQACDHNLNEIGTAFDGADDLSSFTGRVSAIIRPR